ncbi:MAG: hypothetical protein WD354_02400 [Acidimicrobiia bacterium]
MRRSLWVVAALAVMAAVIGAVMVNLPDLKDEGGGAGLAANGTIVYEASGNIRMVNPDGSEDGRVIGALNDGIAQTCPRYSPDGVWLSHQESLFGGLVGDPDLEKVSLVSSHVDADGRPNPAARSATVFEGSNIFEGSSMGPCGRWSPDGGSMALFQVTDDGVLGIAIVSMDEIAVLFLPHTPHLASIAWSPDGTFLAFPTVEGIAMSRPATCEIQVVPTSVTPKELSWSPDGNRFAYTGIPDLADRTDLFLINRDGTNEIQLTRGREWESHPAWSPLGDNLAFVQETCDPNGCRSHIAMHTSGHFVALPPARIDNQVTTSIQGPLVWSPDAQWILHVASGPFTLPGQPLVIAPAQGVPQLVTIEFGITSYDWQRR